MKIVQGACVTTALKPEAFGSGSLNKEDVHYVFALENGMKRHGIPCLINFATD